jgi:hypothetical protein
MHRRTAGSQRPLDPIRMIALDAHGVHLEETKFLCVRNRETKSRRRAAGGTREPESGLEGVGIRRPSRRSREEAPFVHSPFGQPVDPSSWCLAVHRDANTLSRSGIKSRNAMQFFPVSSSLAELAFMATGQPVHFVDPLSPARLFPCNGADRQAIWACACDRVAGGDRRASAVPCRTVSVRDQLKWCADPRGTNGVALGGERPEGPEPCEQDGQGHRAPSRVKDTAPFAATPTVLNVSGEPFCQLTLPGLRGTWPSRDWANTRS